MHPPTPDDDVQPEGAAPRQAPGRFGGGAVLAAALGGIVVGVVVSVATGPLPGASDEVSADGDLRTACRYLEAIHPLDPDDVTVDGPLLWRLDAAVSLATAAGTDGAGGDELETAVTGVTDALRRFDAERLNTALAELRSHCG